MQLWNFTVTVYWLSSTYGKNLGKFDELWDFLLNFELCVFQTIFH